MEKHLKDLREVFVCYIIVTCVLFIFSYKNSDFVLERMLTSVDDFRQTLYFFGMAEGFSVHLKIALSMALIMSIPFGMYKLLWFLRPALIGVEKRYFLALFIASGSLFFLGLAFGYFFVIPTAWKFFMSFESDLLFYLPNAMDYINMFLSLLVAFGLCFQLPIILILLAKAGIVTKSRLKNFRKYNIVLTFMIAAIVTPPDVTSQVCLSAVILLLYEATILFIRDSKNA